MTSKTLTVKSPKPARFPAYTIESEAGETLATVPITASGDSHKLALTMAAGPGLLAALEACVEEMKNTLAWRDALAGEDDAMLTTVNDAEQQIARATGTVFTPHEVEECSNFLSDGRGCCRTCGHFHGGEA